MPSADVAVPTPYRSWAEVHWATFLYELGLVWSYEPVLCDGYLPDFALGVPAKDGVFLEVKGDTNIQALATYLPKCLAGLDSIDFVGTFLIVGGKPLMRHEPRNHHRTLGPGWLCYREDDRWMMTMSGWTWCPTCGAPGFYGVGTRTIVSSCDRNHDSYDVFEPIPQVFEGSEMHLAIGRTWGAAVRKVRDGTR